MTIARVLIVAGSDSGGGAGIQADIKAVTMLGGHPMTAISALTAQNTLGVDAVMPVPVDFVRAQIDAVVGDIGIDAVKIGMIGSADVAEMLIEWLSSRDQSVPVVFDPVMISTSGAALADPATLDRFERLMAVSNLVTPNAVELGVLTGDAIGSVYALERAARRLSREIGAAIVAKGGHVDGDSVTDLLVERGGAVTRFAGPRVATKHSHGTGCTLASAIATGLAQGMPAAEAVGRSVAYVRAALAAAPELGAGHGPIGHALGQRPFDQLTQVG